MHMPLPADDPRQRRPDISKANELFAWKPTVPLQDGLFKTISYFERLLERPIVDDAAAGLADDGGLHAIV